MTNVRKSFSKKVKQAVDKRNIIKYNVKHVETLYEKEKSAQQKILKTSKKWLTLKRSYDNIQKLSRDNKAH